MTSHNLTDGQIGKISGFVADYISTQRQRYIPDATSLSKEQRTSMSDYFISQVLDTTRLLVLCGTRIQNPPFYPMVLQMGIINLPDFSTMTAITFGDVVVSHQPFNSGLLFHELVHAEQYRKLGVPRFAELYVRGFITGGGYSDIPLEVNAYALAGRFERHPHAPFSVEDEVETWIREGQF